MIVKVQVSLATTLDNQRVLMYNEDRSAQYECDVDQTIVDLMNGRLKAFFHAELLPDGELTIHKDAPWQDW